MKNKQAIPLAAMEKLISNAGADRISDKAKIILNKILEEKGEEIAKKAVLYASHAGRQTIKARDIKLAIK
jgi:histone H3/H4